MGYTVAILISGVATLIGVLTRNLLDHSNLIMIYLLCIVYIASRFGKGPSITASVLCVLCFDFFFLPPQFTLEIAGTQFILTFLIMMFIALLISTLTSQVQSQAQAAKIRELRSEALHALSHELSLTRGKTKLLRVAIKHIKNVFDADAIAFLPDKTGKLFQCAGEELKLTTNTNDVASWVFANQRMSGLGQGKHESERTLFLPLQGSKEIQGVLQIIPRANEEIRFSIPDLEFIQTFANQTALCMELASLTEQNQEAQLQIESEQLRNALLSSVSHDLRTPLATITGASSSLLVNKASLSDTDKDELAQVILEESEHMTQLVRNLLEMTKLESGSTNIKKTWQNVEEIIGTALARLEKQLGDRRIVITIADNLPLLAMDEVLMQNVLLNLLENCIKYTPAQSPIEIDARKEGNVIRIEVRDRGRGLKDGEERLLFTKFYRSSHNGKQPGFGLGLAICKAIVNLHGGSIRASRREGGGSIFSLELPIDPNQPLTEINESENLETLHQPSVSAPATESTEQTT